jgi:hypothetical protein
MTSNVDVDEASTHAPIIKPWNFEEIIVLDVGKGFLEGSQSERTRRAERDGGVRDHCDVGKENEGWSLVAHQCGLFGS